MAFVHNLIVGDWYTFIHYMVVKHIQASLNEKYIAVSGIQYQLRSSMSEGSQKSQIRDAGRAAKFEV